MENNPNSNVKNDLGNMPTNNPPSEKKSVPLSVVIIIIVIALIAVGGVFAYQYFATQQTPVVEQTPIETSQNSPSPTAVKDVTMSDINNATYIIAGTGAQFSNGTFHPERNSASSADQGLNAIISSSAFGDINGDGQTDAVVIIEYGMGSRTTRTDTLQVVLNVNGSPQATNVIIPKNAQDDPAIGFEVTSINSTGLITIQLLTLAGVDAYKIIKTTRTYHYINGTLVESPTSGWKTYTNTQYGFEFMYPEKFSSTFASFQQPPSAIVTAQVNSNLPTNISSNGCYTFNIPHINESIVTINGMQFCMSAGGDVGAGQAYYNYYYTTFKNGNYITLVYVVHTSNGCGAYMDTPNYQPCIDFGNNYGTIVAKPIKDSVATFNFTR